jgi:hypothetical protein
MSCQEGQFGVHFIGIAERVGLYSPLMSDGEP